MVNCPKCEGKLVDGLMDINVHIHGQKVGTVKNVDVITCSECDFDAVLLKVQLNIHGIFLGEGREDGKLR